jgi:hypothetical protein
MKKILLSLLAFAIIIPMNASAVSGKTATVFNPITMHRKVVEVGNPHAFDYGYVLEVAYGYKELDDDKLGYSVATGYDKRLSRSSSATQSTIYVTSTLSEDGHQFTMADFGTKVFLIIEPTGSKKETVMCTGVNPTSWTGCTRGLAFYGTSTVAVSANQKTHSAGSQIIMSNVHYIYEELLDKDTDQTITSNIHFDNLPTSTTTAPSLDSELANKKYVDDVTNAGAANGTESVKGIWEGATQSEMSAGTATGTQHTLILQSKYATSTGGNPYTSIPVTGSNGRLDDDFIPTTMTFASSTITSLTVDVTKYTGTGANLNTLTTSSTTNAVNLHYHSNQCYINSSSQAVNTTGNQVLSHTLNVSPTYIEISAVAETTAGGVASISSSNGFATTVSNDVSVYQSIIDGSGNGKSAGTSANIIALYAGNDDTAEAVANLTAVASNSITIDWTTNQNEGGARAFIYKVCK